MLADVFGRNADPAVVAEKMARIRDPHVAPLNALADEIADYLDIPRGHVPYVDPDVGGVNARMLVLLDNPSSRAEAGTGSGLLSLDNDDRTARNCREAYAEHGIDWSDVVHWNVVPFPVADTNGGSTPGERGRGARWTRELVDRLPHLEIVLLLGYAARDGWDRAGIQRVLYRPDQFVPGGKVPHCSQRGLADPDRRQAFHTALEDVAERLRAKLGSIPTV
ncbi:uracil-DNA glycosylase [Gordonia otitidis]|uniref:uracil-DNA glycosylase n=1 Tax=Gordonia otitidis TaxID=249058 RepID=UPI001D14A329|nr:uracil-DNA glycosylase [Gordonia otitidis]UEA60663.1 uracil-DNA glycosylase [Gordonia otitidis]